jgi:hypothetical protein
VEVTATRRPGPLELADCHRPASCMFSSAAASLQHMLFRVILVLWPPARNDKGGDPLRLLLWSICNVTFAIGTAVQH